MSEKVQTQMQDSDDQDQSEEPTKVEIQTPQSPPEGDTEAKVAEDDVAKIYFAINDRQTVFAVNLLASLRVEELG